MASSDTERAARFARGMQILNSIDGEAGAQVIEALADIAPELSHQIVAWGIGDIYSRPGLEPAHRQLVTLAVLTALGDCEGQLRVHIGTALKVGITPHQVIETLLHASVYCGFPRVLNAVFVAKRVFAEKDLLPLD